MRTAYRVLCTAIAVGAIFPIGTMPAHADTAPVAVEASNWFWSAQTSGTAPNGAGIPNIPVTASGVNETQLAVAYKGEHEEGTTDEAKPDKETYLRWNVYFLPEDAQVTEFTFTMFLDPEAEQMFVPVEVNQVPGQPARGGQPVLIACKPTIGFGDGAGDAFAVKPTDDCGDQLVGSFDPAAQSYTFDATIIAQDWVAGMDNHGLGIRPAMNSTEPFQLVFKGAKDVKATITYTVPEAEPETPIVQPDVVLPPVPPTDTSVFVPDTQPVPQPQPQPPPVVMQTKAPVVVQPIAANPLTASRGLTPVFWFAMISGVLLIGVASMILGDPVEAAAGSRHRVRTSGRHRLTIPAGAPARVTTPSARPRTV